MYKNFQMSLRWIPKLTLLGTSVNRSSISNKRHLSSEKLALSVFNSASATKLWSTQQFEEIPDTTSPEVAFIGRTNCGV